MKYYQLLFAVVLFLAFASVSCRKEENPTDKTFTLPQEEIRDGGPGKDGIPALENPTFISESEATYLDDENLVIGYKVGTDIRAYPHAILDWHEIINDDVQGEAVAITYCPLTGTGIGWSRIVAGETTTFGVSGLLYNSNLIPYDRATDSDWSQMLLESISGTRSNQSIETFPVVETTWATWKKMYPTTKVVSDNTGHSRNYSRYPYGDYRTDQEQLLFPITNYDTRLPFKQRVHGVIVNGTAKVYPVSDFSNSAVEIITDEFEGSQLLIVGHSAENFVTSFQLAVDDNNTYTAVQDQLPVIFEDALGNQYDVFGEVVSGPAVGERLSPTISFIGYWFAWGTFYEGAEIYTP